MSVLLNSKNAALNQEFQTNGQTNVNLICFKLRDNYENNLRIDEKCT